jgi:hypothetical protein
MEENPYKSPETRGAPSEHRPMFRILAKALLVLCGIPIAFYAVLGVFMTIDEQAPDAAAIGLALGLAAAGIFYGASRV